MLPNDLDVKKLSILIQKFGMRGTARVLTERNIKRSYVWVINMAKKYNIPHKTRLEMLRIVKRQKLKKVLESIDKLVQEKKPKEEIKE